MSNDFAPIKALRQFFFRKLIVCLYFFENIDGEEILSFEL